MRGLLPLLLLLSGCATAPAPALDPFPPGGAYAWATFDEGAVLDGGASGLADRGNGRPLTIDDPVRVASITKVVVALGVMRLVESGKLDLDADVSTYLGWDLRNPAYPDRPITLRLLLSHQSGLRDGIDYALPLGTTVRQAVANEEAFDLEHPPGTFFRYSNLNFPVVAAAMEQVTGERFDRLMERLVLSPIGLDACFNWTTCSDGKIARAVVLYDHPSGKVVRDDLRGLRPACPVVPRADGNCDISSYRPGDNGALFSPQGGLRASVRDLSVIGRLLLNRGRHGGKTFLREESIDAITRPAWVYDGRNGDTDKGFYCTYGLAIQLMPTRAEGCQDDLFGSGRRVLGHAGDAYGLRSGLWIDPDTRTGIAFFSINNGDEPPRGRTAYRAVEEWLAALLPR